ncbi:hypothetical protein ACHHYP_00350 [Achlya hypogyna]|uniref:Xanthine dehydrogenase n=1 Tax=Achlya hypogyna TaxID=1202772 RepID=A0A1V9ZUL0_ACHHY|nr:hypothetical protein ACHHYP_00350 [Achlya hypogyna]
MATPWGNSLTFAVNGVKVVLPEAAVGSLRLVDYLRDGAGLKGTKVACGEGGCGACTVVLRHRGTTSDALVQRSVNACLLPLAAVDGMEVLTVEGVGSTKALDPIQQTLVTNSGMQCGYCTPGWVMNMYELLQNDAAPSQAKIEGHFDGNLCRCTGYRPILHSMHAFGSAVECTDSTKKDEEVYMGEEQYEFVHVAECDESEATRARKGCTTSCATCPKKANVIDMEDLGPAMTCKQDHPPPDFIRTYTPVPLRLRDRKRVWYRALTLAQVAEVQKAHAPSEIMLIGGLTSRGVAKYFNGTAPYRQPSFAPVLLDITHIPELKAISSTEAGVVVGAAVTLTDLLAALTADTLDDVRVLAKHIRRIANHQVRNAGTWAGNLALARQFPAFPSDLAVGLAGFGATLSVAVAGAAAAPMSVLKYLRLPHEKPAMLLSVTLPATASKSTFMCHKVAQRAVNSHAHVNAATRFVVNSDNVVVRATVVVGGKQIVPCTKTEAYLADKPLSEAIFQRSLATLLEEVASHDDAFSASVVRAFWYKSWLRALPSLSSRTLESTVPAMPRAISSGTQKFPAHDATAPVGKPVQKLASKLLATGEARFVADLLPPPSMLFGAIVYSTEARKQVVRINVDEARDYSGVVDVILAEDIVGKNATGDGNEFLFVPHHNTSVYVGAALGLVVARSSAAAQEAAALVKVTYGPVQRDTFWTDGPPIVSVAMARKAKTLVPATASTPNPLVMPGSDDAVPAKIRAAPNTINGAVDIGSQRHMYMEPQATSVHPAEDGGVEVHASCQNPTFVQRNVAAILDIPQHAVNVQMKRAGGGFGGKLTRNIINAGAAAVAASKLGVPVQVVNDRNTDFQTIGGREAMTAEYSVGFTADGRILALDVTLHCALGGFAGDNTGDINMAVLWADGAYHIPHMRCQAWMYLTNTPTCTSVRAPGVPNSTMVLEIVIEHIALELNKPVSWIQSRNMLRDGHVTPYGQVLENVTLPRIWQRLLHSADVLRRKEQVAYFNANNRWKKKGLSVTPVKYGMGISGLKYGAQVSVFAGDGTVLVTHGGCEIGQGIDTKAAQMAAYALGIPLETIQVRATSTDMIPNSDATGGSSTSESIARSVQAACTTLNNRLKPIREANPKVTEWAKIIQRAHDAGVHLSAAEQPFATPSATDKFDYFVYAAAASEVEVDVLTGEISLVRTDIVYDCGVSFNPAVDIGQIEGAFVMALGFFFFEEVEYDADGRLLSTGTWEYKIPSTLDIPQCLNVTLLEKAENEKGIMSSKAVGEPPFQLANSVYFAIKEALRHSRDERGHHGFFRLDLPATVKRRQQAANVLAADFHF